MAETAKWGNGWGQQAASASMEPQTEYDGSALDWDDEISFSGAMYTVLKPGEYDFTVKSFERGYYNGSTDGKVSACPLAKVTFEVETPEGKATIQHTFFLRKWESSLDFIYNYFVSIGMVTPEQRDAKQPFTPNWQAAVGRHGRFEIKNTPKKDDPKVIYNNIKKFIDPPKG